MVLYSLVSISKPFGINIKMDNQLKQKEEQMDREEFMQEYLSRLAFSMAQFWPENETLPDKEAEEDAVYYTVAIRRLSVFRRAELAKMMWDLVDDKVRFFSSETERPNRIKTIRGVIARFPLLADADHERTFKNDAI